jgi:hypothetical protein
MTIDPGDLPPSARKPTIADIVMDRAKPNMPAGEMMDAIVPMVRAHYPDMTPEQLGAVIRAEIMAWNAQMDERGFWADFEAAAALDPDWYETDRHSIGCRPGALHDTPQKLVTAYRDWLDKDLPVEDLVEALMQRAIPVHANPGEAKPITAALMRIIDAHPRRAELLSFAAEQARRAGKLGKAKDG